jgi:hypothetical protein
MVRPWRRFAQPILLKVEPSTESVKASDSKVLSAGEILTENRLVPISGAMVIESPWNDRESGAARHDVCTG